MMDDERMPDASNLVPYLPDSTAIIVRSRQRGRIAQIVAKMKPIAADFGVKLITSCQKPPKRLSADGVHIPEEYLRFWRRTDILRLQPGLVSVSAHSMRAMPKARAIGADVALLSPVFATDSHKSVRSLGFWRFCRLSRGAELPIIALGGISEPDLRRLRLAKISGVAGISLFLR